jgi:hypothetical protein
MTARTIIGACTLLVLFGVAVYLLFQIPAAYAIGGVVALVAIFAAVAHDAPADLS